MSARLAIIDAAAPGRCANDAVLHTRAIWHVLDEVAPLTYSIAVHRTVVINAVGLAERLMGANTPRLREFVARGTLSHIEPVVPAVTCSAQSTYLTGLWPDEHGIVGNGWYFRDECEIRFWRQSNRLVAGEKVWETARKLDPNFTCANICWWFAMYSSADFTVTPRPMYPADGRKLPDIWTHPSDLREKLQGEIGQFPLFQFWGPGASIESTRWISGAAMFVYEHHHPTLTLIYLPHLDYALQRYGPRDPRSAASVRELDDEIGRLLDYFKREDDPRIVILSEYGISPVSKPVHLNRVLRENGFLAIRNELGHELLDAGASAAFAVADHQIAHVYVNDSGKLSAVRALIENAPGVTRVYSPDERKRIRLDHPRAGDLVVLAQPDSWFTYYYWLDDSAAPDFARTVDIHRKPGYDPVELFLDPQIRMPKLKVGWTLAKRRMGFRSLMKVIPLDATLVKGSHGLPPSDLQDQPIFLSNCPALPIEKSLSATSVKKQIVQHLTVDR